MLISEKAKSLVSIIIPNYNHAKFLDERIQSVLNQTYQNFELIILDDKSSDNSVEVINQYKDDPRVSSIIINKDNSGSTFKEWYKGIEIAKGEIIWIAESDDSCAPNMLETLVHGYVENNAVLAFSRSCRYDVEGNKSIYNLQTLLPGNVVMNGKDFISAYMIQCNAVANASSVVFNRNIALGIDKQYMKMQGDGDWLFWIEMMEHGNVFFSTKEQNYFRYHKSNTTKMLGQQGVSAIEHKIIFDYLVNHGYITNVKNERRKCLNYYLNAEYESHKVRRKVLKLWDKNGIGRLLIFLGNIKRDLLLFIKNI